MRGSIAKGKKWYAVICDGPDPLTGKDRRRWVMAGTRKGDAEKVLDDACLVIREHHGEERSTLRGLLQGLEVNSAATVDRNDRVLPDRGRIEHGLTFGSRHATSSA